MDETPLKIKKLAGALVISKMMVLKMIFLEIMLLIKSIQAYYAFK